MNKRVLILIPARYASSRFPGKPLAIISGKSMIQRVCDNCRQTELEGIDVEVCVVTDDDRIEKHVKSFGGKVCRVDDDVPSGSERIHLAYKRFFENGKWDRIINVQGDEPLLKSDLLKNLIDFHLSNTYELATVVKGFIGFDDNFKDPNKVKAVYSEETGKCHYFSRAPIPFMRDENIKLEDQKWYLHVGIYSYMPSALEAFCKSPASYYEEMEKLEQLRALDLGMSIGAIVTDKILLGVDVPEDVKKLEGVLGES